MAQLLIMEDDEDFAVQLRADLVDRGHEVTVFGTASEALYYAKSHRVDLAIADLLVRKDGALSTDGGIKFIAGLRQIQKKSMPIIAISGSFHNRSGSNFESTARTVGANVVLAKPFFPQDLADEIDKQLAWRGETSAS